MSSRLPYFFKNKQQAVDHILLYLSLVLSGLIIFHLGYGDRFTREDVFVPIVFWTYNGLVLLSALRTFTFIGLSNRIRLEHYSAAILLLYPLTLWISRLDHLSTVAFMQEPSWLYVGVFLVALTELSRQSLFLDRLYFNPTLLFVISFLGLILLGTVLLKLPNSVTIDTERLRFVDALFMATSAVCITGLSVVDVSNTFSSFGRGVLLFLIQLGGLGIMTFTGFFGYFLSGGFSYKNQLMYGELLGQQKVGSVTSTLLKIIFVTLLVEAIGAILLFVSVPAHHFSGNQERVFFALFHAISAFCNAGFSIAPGGFEHPDFRFNYQLQMVLVSLFVIGGLGFTIVFNGYSFTKQWLTNCFHRLVHHRRFVHRPWIITFNGRLMAWSSLILVVVSTCTMLFFEYHNTLAVHEGFWKKLMAATFMGNSARTSGFTTVNPAQIAPPMLIITMLLMWIGASPGSTGGGIKNTTFAVALLNIIRIARGKEHLELFKREVSSTSIQRAFSILTLSIFAMGISITALSITDGNLSYRDLVFEVVSAYSTCGLSLGATPSLSDGGRIIISATMFVGRVGFLTLLVATVKHVKTKNYHYPEEKTLF